MNPTELYDQVALEFPSLWPQDPAWLWVNIHDGGAPKLNVIAELIERYVGSSEVVVIVHAEPGIGARLPKERAASYVAQYVLQHDVQVSDPQFTSFVSVSRNGVATGDA